MSSTPNDAVDREEQRPEKRHGLQFGYDGGHELGVVGGSELCSDERDIEGLDVVGQSTHRDEIDASLSIGAEG